MSWDDWGGDEFAVIAMIEKEHCGEVFRERIQQFLTDFNEKSDKPYNVGMSIGLLEFTIQKDTDLEQILRIADSKLYEEKKTKKKKVYKNRES